MHVKCLVNSRCLINAIHSSSTLTHLSSFPPPPTTSPPLNNPFRCYYPREPDVGVWISKVVTLELHQSEIDAQLHCQQCIDLSETPLLQFSLTIFHRDVVRFGRNGLGTLLFSNIVFPEPSNLMFPENCQSTGK